MPPDVPLAFLQAGLLAAFVAAAIERVVPLAPSWIVLGLLGMACKATDGHLAAWVAATVLGSALGMLIAFRLGRLAQARPRRRALCGALPLGHAVAMMGQRLRRARGPRPFAVLALSQCVPGLRAAAPLAAGLGGVPLAIALPPLLLGSAIWNTAFLLAGYHGAAGTP